MQDSGVQMDFGVCSIKRKNGTTQERYIRKERKAEGKTPGISGSARTKEDSERYVRRSREKECQGRRRYGLQAMESGPSLGNKINYSTVK